MRRALYLTHPQVRIDPALPVPDWGLSEVGEARAAIAAKARWTGGLSAIFCSEEVKAIETALVIGHARAIPLCMREDMHENDRSATGFLPPAEFEQVADAFFARPETSVRGWERAADAQNRIVRAVERELATQTGTILFVGHGGVGTLLLCHLLGEPISRSRDQKQGGGNVFCWDAVSGRVLHAWLPLEDARVGEKA